MPHLLSHKGLRHILDTCSRPTNNTFSLQQSYIRLSVFFCEAYCFSSVPWKPKALAKDPKELPFRLQVVTKQSQSIAKLLKCWFLSCHQDVSSHRPGSCIKEENISHGNFLTFPFMKICASWVLNFFSWVLKFFRGVWAKFQILPLRSVMFAIKSKSAHDRILRTSILKNALFLPL